MALYRDGECHLFDPLAKTLITRGLQDQLRLMFGSVVVQELGWQSDSITCGVWCALILKLLSSSGTLSNQLPNVPCAVERGFFVSACWTFLEAIQTSWTIASLCELEAAQLQLLYEEGAVAIEKGVSTEGNSDRKRKDAPTSIERPAKRLRRELTVSEKLWLCAEHASGVSKNQLGAKYNLDGKSVALILSKRDEFASMHEDRRFKTTERKRAGGGGRKATYAEEEEAVAARVREERALKKNITRSCAKEWLQAEIAKKHPRAIVTEKLLDGFFRRESLSEKKVDRQRSKTMIERLSLAASFFGYLHGVQRLIATPTVIVNFDETPLCPLGQRVMRVVGPIGESAETEMGNVSSTDTKRFATVITCVAGVTDPEDQPPPFVIFKQANLPRDAERQKYPPQVHVAATETGVVNGDFMTTKYSEYLQKYFRGKRLITVYDSARAHLVEGFKTKLKENGMIPAVIPGGMTLDLQYLDRSFFFLFKLQYSKLADDFILSSKKKMNAQERRINVMHWVYESHLRTLKDMDVLSGMRRLGYVLGHRPQISTLPNITCPKCGSGFGWRKLYDEHMLSCRIGVSIMDIMKKKK